MNPTPSLKPRVSFILPCRNEAASLRKLLPSLRSQYPDAEIVVVDDGSNDDSASVAQLNGARVVNAPYGMGNGAAVKRGARLAHGEVLVFMDADGQHDPADAKRLLMRLDENYDMAVGARSRDSQAGWHRALANRFYNALASWVTGHRIMDLTSGFRAVRADKFREFLHLLPNGFSYPTTITMAFFRSAYAVAYVPIRTQPRIGNSHIRTVRDGARFLLIIFRIATLYSPLKLFLPVSLAFFLMGLGYYGYTYAHMGRFTNMSTLLLSASVIVFMIGLVSEQITALVYSKSK
jgi:glycosyltransferase involved in cell wall biosynthesis